MFVQIPPAITLMDPKNPGKPMKIGQTDDKGQVEIVDAVPMTCHAFASEHFLPLCKGSKEYRQADRLLKKLEQAERQPAEDSWVEIGEEDVKLFNEKMGQSQLNGVVGRQFLPFMNAFEDAKRERPKAVLKAVEEPVRTS